MKKLKSTIIASLMIVFVGCGESASRSGETSAALREALVRRELVNGRVSLLVPSDFIRLDEELLRVKYPMENRPEFAFSNAKGSINITFALKPNALAPNEIEKALKGTSRGFHNLFPSATWYREETVKINGRDFFIVEVTTPSLTGNIRNIIAGTSVDGRLMMFGFNCTVDNEHDWAPIGAKIIESIQII